MNKRAGIVFAGGEGPGQLSKEPFERALIIAADSGYFLAKSLGIEPQVLIGDMDSIKRIPKEQKDLQIIPFPKDKDYSDTELAVRWLIDQGVDRITIVGAGGGRLDHLLEIIRLFELYHQLTYWIAGGFDAQVIKGECTLPFEPGQMLSFYPLSEEPLQISSQGLKWELNDLLLTKKSFSLSNRVRKNELQLKINKGRILMIIPKEGENLAENHFL